MTTQYLRNIFLAQLSLACLGAAICFFIGGAGDPAETPSCRFMNLWLPIQCLLLWILSVLVIITHTTDYTKSVRRLSYMFVFIVVLISISAAIGNVMRFLAPTDCIQYPVFIIAAFFPQLFLVFPCRLCPLPRI